MKILLIGARGQLAQDIAKSVAGHDEIVPVTHEQLDIRDAHQVAGVVEQARPECIINTAAFHKVDLCEDEPENAFAVNEGGVLNVARAAHQQDALLVQFSTDYVFDGAKHNAYVESDEPKPLSVYGRSRLAGERAVESACERYLIIRTCGLYGSAGSQSKAGNFVETMLRLGASGKRIRVVNDQICTPTSTLDLAQNLLWLIHSGARGIFHMTNSGECSWFEFARQIFRSAKMPADLVPCTTVEFGAKAARPAYSVLENRAFRAAGFADFKPWQEAMREYIAHRATPADSSSVNA